MLTQAELKLEMLRRQGTRARLLLEFKRKRTLTTADLMDIAGPGMSSRLKELKRKGYLIDSYYVRPGVWEYVYRGEEDDGKEYGDTY